jgi:Brp/Blh family beta-carotene 15,15'-monooxygenase
MYIQSKLFKAQIAIQLILIVLVSLIPITFNAQAILCGILLCTVGIPHGSNDYLYRSDKSAKGMMKFLAVYLGTMLLYLVLWWIAPLLALLLFFVISFHHFGQSNFENESLKYAPSWLWGVWILALPVLLHFDEAIGIFLQMLSTTTNTPIVSTSSTHSAWPFILIAVFGTVYIISLLTFERKNILLYFTQFIIVTIWYFLTPLLAGFIIAFCLWHSLQSMQHQASYFKQSTSRSLHQFLIAMLPFSLMALISFGVYVYYRSFNVAEAFILLSIITLPHVIVMHRLYHKINHVLNVE